MLTTREKYLAAAVVVIGGLALINWKVIRPYFDSRAKLKDDIMAAEGRLGEMKGAALLRPLIDEKWANLEKAGLRSDPSLAKTETMRNIERWGASRKLVVEFPNIVAQQAQGDFIPVEYTVVVKGTDQGVGELIYLIETAEYPLKINSVQMAPVKEGQREVKATISVTTVAMTNGAKPATRPAAVSVPASAPATTPATMTEKG